MGRDLPTLELAIEWANARWANQRTVPIRLHKREEEGVGLMHDRKGCTCLACTDGPSESGLGSHAFSNAFASALDGRPDTTISQDRTVDCWHPLLPKGRPDRDCPECIGTRVKKVRSDLFAFPMSLALNRLRNDIASRRQLHPYILVLALASHGWQPKQAARSLDMPWDRAEPLFLLALRKLHSRYEEGPVKTTVSSSWLALSDSQRNAITAGETAA